ncbi:SDR family NAD(P)-dependent oxidoreductase [Arthrobacter sp. NPDC058097]|uniref:SDR family NAD(P)-dependent oxidoreductase n=1 Tax=Arthrobacter sp. NPDC058097 TaxID=3346340 RepID=UPI0036D97E6A
MSTSIQRPSRVLISGAAGGLGTAVARRFAADGARVALTDLNAEGVAALADELGGVALPADGTDRDALKIVVARAAEELGGIDAVIATQGAQIPSTTSPKTAKGWDLSIDINLNGPFYLASEAVPHLVQSRGSIVMISSSAGLFSGPPGTAGYTAAKTGVIGLVRWLAREYGPHGVRVNAVSPGWIRTALGEGAMKFLAERDGLTIEEAYDKATLSVPLRRAAAPDEIAAVCAFLSSSDAAMVTGHTLIADGGAAVIDSSTEIFN